MSSFTPWLEVTVTGFVYLIAFLLIVLAMAQKRDLSLSEDVRSFVPYIAVLAVFFSYILGLAAHYLTQYVIFYFNNEYSYELIAKKLASRDISPERLENLRGAYGTMVMFRHLFPGFILLGISALIWLWKQPHKIKWSVFIACIVLSIIFLLAWRVQRGFYIQVRDTTLW